MNQISNLSSDNLTQICKLLDFNSCVSLYFSSSHLMRKMNSRCFDRLCHSIFSFSFEEIDNLKKRKIEGIYLFWLCTKLRTRTVQYIFDSILYKLENERYLIARTVNCSLNPIDEIRNHHFENYSSSVIYNDTESQLSSFMNLRERSKPIIKFLIEIGYSYSPRSYTNDRISDESTISHSPIEILPKKAHKMKQMRDLKSVRSKSSIDLPKPYTVSDFTLTNYSHEFLSLSPFYSCFLWYSSRKNIKYAISYFPDLVVNEKEIEKAMKQNRSYYIIYYLARYNYMIPCVNNLISFGKATNKGIYTNAYAEGLAKRGSLECTSYLNEKIICRLYLKAVSSGNEVLCKCLENFSKTMEEITGDRNYQSLILCSAIKSKNERIIERHRQLLNLSKSNIKYTSVMFHRWRCTGNLTFISNISISSSNINYVIKKIYEYNLESILYIDDRFNLFICTNNNESQFLKRPSLFDLPIEDVCEGYVKGHRERSTVEYVRNLYSQRYNENSVCYPRHSLLKYAKSKAVQFINLHKILNPKYMFKSSCEFGEFGIAYLNRGHDKRRVDYIIEDEAIASEYSSSLRKPKNGNDPDVSKILYDNSIGISFNDTNNINCFLSIPYYSGLVMTILPHTKRGRTDIVKLLSGHVIKETQYLSLPEY